MPISRIARRPSLGGAVLALIPFLAMCFSVPLWDRLYPTVFGLPFNLFWLISWILLTPVCMWAAYRLEMRRTPAEGERTNEGSN